MYPLLHFRASLAYIIDATTRWPTLSHHPSKLCTCKQQIAQQ
jgi:hypothetical protein